MKHLRPVLTAFLFSAISWSALASAEPNDAAASKLAEQAIFEDYLNLDYPSAEKKLTDALAKCQKGCSAKVKGDIYGKLGVLYSAMDNRDAAVASFREGLKANSALVPDPDLSTEQVKSAYEEAKGGKDNNAAAVAAGAAGAAVAVGLSGDDDENSEGMAHLSPSEQKVMTPLPIYTELDADIVAKQVKVRFRIFGDPNWKTLVLRKIGKGYGSEIPCLEIGTTTGDLLYYISAEDADGDEIAHSGSKTAPNKVAIRTALTGEAPHLPGQAPPASCGSADDCPPDFPGCSNYEEEKEEDKPAEDKVTRNWIGIDFMADMTSHSGSAAPCDLNAPSFGGGSSCFYNNGDQVWTQPTNQYSVNGGLVLATTRLMLSYNHVFGDNIVVGARVGIVFGNSPSNKDQTTQQPTGTAPSIMHIEARGAYYFGRDPFATTGFFPFTNLVVGFGEYDSSVQVKIQYAGDSKTYEPAQWQRVGTIFGGLGAGVKYGITKHIDLDAELRGTYIFAASSGFSLGARIGLAYGF